MQGWFFYRNCFGEFDAFSYGMCYVSGPAIRRLVFHARRLGAPGQMPSIELTEPQMKQQMKPQDF